MPILTLLESYWRLLTALVLAVVLVGTHLQAYVHGKETVQARWNEERITQEQEIAKIAQAAQEKERQMQEAADKLRRQKNEQINRLATDLADALDRLRSRPTRDSESNMPADTGTRRGCYPAQLYREDASNLIKLAGEADQLRVALTQCQEQYAKVRAALTK